MCFRQRKQKVRHSCEELEKVQQSVEHERKSALKRAQEVGKSQLMQ